MKRQSAKIGLLSNFVWKIYENLPDIADDILLLRYPWILPFKNLRVPVLILKGKTQAEETLGTVIAAGSSGKTKFLIENFFRDEPDQEDAWNILLWNLPSELKKLRTSADLTVVHIDRLSASILFGTDYLYVPEDVGSTLITPEVFNELTSGNSSLKSDMKKVRQTNLSYDVSHLQSDFEYFYYRMYVPFVRKRHGEKATIRNFHKLRRNFRQGGMIRIWLNTKFIAGGLFQLEGRTLSFFVMGVLEGEEKYVEMGAVPALYSSTINHARALDCELVDFGLSRPLLNDGVLRYKLKWGVRVSENRYVNHGFLIHWNKLNKALVSFLENSPLIFRDRDGLSAIKLIDRDEPVTQKEAEKTRRSSWMPGLKRLYLASTSGWEDIEYSPHRTSLVDLRNDKEHNCFTPLIMFNKIKRAL